jgi:hypothetical protein
LRAGGKPVPEWILGGGTALMIHAGHRFSKDIDAFIDDVQLLPFLSPRLGGENVWNCDTYQEAANHLRLVFPEGEVDFIVAAPVTTLLPGRKTIECEDVEHGLTHEADVEHPVETALKKLRYRGASLKIRDIFDISVVDALYPDLLRQNLPRVAQLKATILSRLQQVPQEFLRQELNELEIADGWRERAELCLDHVHQLVHGIAEPRQIRAP